MHHFLVLSGNNIHLYGGGTLDGNGQVWWDTLNNSHNTGTAGGSSTTFARPVPLTVGNATNVLVENITQIEQLRVPETNVTYRNINISSVSYSSSPRLTQMSTTMTTAFPSSRIAQTSFLGQYAGRLISSRMSRPNSTIGGGTGYVKNVTFQDFVVQNVTFPILIDQCYSTDPTVCAQYPSNLTISIFTTSMLPAPRPALRAAGRRLRVLCELHRYHRTGTQLTSPNGTATYICKNITSTAELDFNCTAPSSA
ncbi:putative exopolygalacturonase X [Grifola frondosa]|uniref:galacturonan 1,4-alpha-galacturonidase n=1 Tax=Grifola frondosa TaxID=5627 RepID=A0A1C7LU78_GRIFR|nr:putative exopolygalacturonase X [Grifola frondosa]